jgi:hypothetical protein
LSADRGEVGLLDRQRLKRLGAPRHWIGEAVGRDDIVTTARTYTHVVADERELDYTKLV